MTETLAFDNYLHAWLGRIEGDYIPHEEAEKFLEFMRESHPAELEDWLYTRARMWVLTVIHGTRSTSRKVGRSSVERFSDAVEAHEQGDSELLRAFAMDHTINKEGVSRKAADMVGADHLYVAERYEKTGKTAAMLGAFHRAVAKKVGARRTGDVLSEEQYKQLMDRFLTGKQAA